MASRRDYLQGLFAETICRDYLQRLFAETICRDYSQGLFAGTIRRDYNPKILKHRRPTTRNFQFIVR